MSDKGSIKRSWKSGRSVPERPSWLITEEEVCMVLGKKHLGGPGHPDCEGDIEVKAHRACITRPTVIKEAEKGRRVIVAKCFTKPAVEGARGLGVELREWKHGKEN